MHHSSLWRSICAASVLATVCAGVSYADDNLDKWLFMQRKLMLLHKITPKTFHAHHFGMFSLIQAWITHYLMYTSLVLLQ